MMYNHLFYYFFKKYNKILDGIASGATNAKKNIIIYIIFGNNGRLQNFF